MASQILGVDLGAYSVKVVVTTPGFRQALVQQVVEERVPEGESPHLVRAAEVVGRIVNRFAGEDDSVYASIAGDKVFLHVLEFGFKSLRRSELADVVGGELEGLLPIDLEDMVYSFEQIPRITETVATELDEEEDPSFVGVVADKPVVHGRVAEVTEGMRVLAAATQQVRAEELLVAMRTYGVDPRGLLAAPAPYARLAEKLGSAESEAGGLAILDLGHMRSDFCMARGGKPIFARTINRGGHHVTQVMAKAWNISYEDAERGKHSEGFVASAAQPAMTENGQRISEVLTKEMRSLVRELKRTLRSCRAKTGFYPDRLLLVGGASRLRGLTAFLAEHLQLPVEILNQDAAVKLLGDNANSASLDTAALALGIAMDGASAKPSFDLRQGTLAYKADLSFLRKKRGVLAAAAVAIMGFGVLSAHTGVRKLRKAEEILDRRIAIESAKAFGEQLNASEVMTRIGPIENGGKLSPIPKMTAWDMLIAFNGALPDKEKATLDIDDIAIEPGKIVLQAASSPVGETTALQGIKNLEESLRDSECFKDFSSPESKPGSDGKREFSLTIKSSCNK